ncbi:MAG: MFS transporter [Candidatus Rokuibacteriota bacterium]
MISLLISTIGGVGMWSAVVVLPAVQADFAVARAAASLPYTVSMIFFVVGQILMGRLADRSGVMVPVIIGTLALTLGYVAASFAGSLGQFIAAYGLLIGFLGSPATFGPVIADISHWFSRRRGIAVAICSSGSYLAGTVWPPIVQHFTETAGWRATHLGIGVFCAVTMLPLAFVLRRRAPATQGARAPAPRGPRHLPGSLSPTTLQALLMAAGVACCVAMAMPQVHIVAYSGDLGHGVARGAEMLSMMLGFGIVSRLASGWLADRIGPLITLLLGSGLQALSLLLYLPFDGLASLYVVSALFGLSQGGIVPSYALIVREYFPPAEAGTRIALVLSATVAGMALGGWMSGAIFDHTQSYRTAFLNGFVWNLLNVGIALWLVRRLAWRMAPV